MTTPNQAPLTLVVGVDFSDLSEKALYVAKNLAARCAPSVVHAVHVVPELAVDGPPPSLRADLAKDGLERLIGYLSERGLSETMEAHVLVGDAGDLIPTFARSAHADVIVLGTAGKTGIARLVMGSVADQVMRSAPCSVLVVRERELGPEEYILPPLPGQNMHEQHPRAASHHEGPNVPSAQYGMGALTFRV